MSDTIPFINGSDNFHQTLADADKPILVDFTASWCGPCKALSPVLDQIASEQSDFSIIKVDADANADICEKYDVSGLPTMILFEDAEEMIRLSGAMSKPDLLARVEPFI